MKYNKHFSKGSLLYLRMWYVFLLLAVTSVQQLYAQCNLTFHSLVQDNTVSLWATVADSTVKYSYYWNLGDGSVRTGENVKYDYSKAGTYSVVLKRIAGADTCITKQPVTVTEKSLCQTGFTYESNSLGKVDFYGLSFNGDIQYFRWYLGNGVVLTSETKALSYVYEKTGYYDVRLVKYTTSGDSCEAKQQIYVKVENPCLVDFKTMANKQSVSFFPSVFDSLATSKNNYFWRFGDGETSLVEYPVHNYMFPGIYKVSLSGISGKDTCTVTKEVRVYDANTPCTKGFGLKSYLNTVYVNAVSEDKSLQYFWNFGDGTYQYGFNSEHTYSRSGEYSVTLKYINYNGDTCSSTQNVKVSACNFYINPYQKGNLIDFYAVTNTDSSSYKFFWEFGDGTSSYGNNHVTHKYLTPGNYTVKGRMQGFDTCDASVVVNILDTTSDCRLSFTSKMINDSIVFVPESGIKSDGIYFWDFGDGSSSYSKGNISHLYKNAGNYRVSLVTRYSHFDSCFVTQEVNVGTGCNLSMSTSLKNNGLSAIPADSYGLPYKYAWNFGDGDSLMYGYYGDHQYSKPGIYTIELTRFGKEVCSKKQEVKISTFCNLGFTVSKDTLGYIFQVVNAKDSVNYFWNFGDGTYSTGSSVYHVFKESHGYYVRLRAEENGTDSCVTGDFLSFNGVVPVCNSDIKYTNNKYIYSFELSGLDSDSSYYVEWSFGDGQISKDGYHVYSKPGNYYVQAKRISKNGEVVCKVSKDVKVEYVQEVCVADFNYTISKQRVNFTPVEISGRYSYKWIFGDGNYANTPWSSNYYNSPGSYKVTLVKSDSLDSCIVSKIIYVPEIVKCNVSILSKQQDQKVYFYATSADSAFSYEWNYGDGSYGFGKTVEHEYKPGNYVVKLMAASWDTCYSDTLIIIKENKNTGTLHGSAKASGKTVDFATVTAFRLVNKKYEFAASDDINPLDSGFYNISGLEAGTYVIHVSPSTKSAFFFTHEATYFGDVTDWQKAAQIDPFNKMVYLVNLVESKKISNKDTNWNKGKDKVKGKVTSTGSNMRITDGQGQPLVNALVTLFNESGEKLSTELTDADGYYEFSNLLGGNYKIGFTYPGAAEDVILSVSLDGNENTVEEKSPELDTQLIITGNQNISVMSSKVYPNPATDFISVENNFANEMSIRIFDAAGILVKEESSVSGGKINIQELGAGLYMIRAQTGDAVTTNQFVKF